MGDRKSWYRVEENLAKPDVATVYLHDEIGLWGVTSKDFVQDLANLTQPSLKLHINSPGGSVDDGIAIFNALKSRSGEIEVHVDALCASIATVIAMAASPGKLYMAPHSRMMIHEAMALGMGFASDFEKLATRLKDTTRNIAGVYVGRAGKDIDHWLGLMASETWFTDQQAVDEGLADEVGRDVVVENFRVASQFALLNKYRSRPDFEAEVMTPAPGLDVPHRGRLVALREEIDALIGEIGPEKAEIEAEKAPEGGPEAPPAELDPAVQAKAELERRLALIRL